MTKDEFTIMAAELVEENFPKGKSTHRGEAMVLMAQVCARLMAEGVIDNE